MLKIQPTILYFFVSNAHVGPIIEALLVSSGEKCPNIEIRAFSILLWSPYGQWTALR